MHVHRTLPHGRRGIARHMTGTTRRRVSRKNLEHPGSKSPSHPSPSRSGSRGFWMRRTPCGLSAARLSPISTPSSNPLSSTCSATPSPIPWGGKNEHLPSVGDEIGFLTSGSRGWAKYYAEDGDTFIRIQNLKDGQLDLGDIAFVRAPESVRGEAEQRLSLQTFYSASPPT